MYRGSPTSAPLITRIVPREVDRILEAEGFH